MSKKTINFENMSNESMAQLKDFAESRIAIAKEDLRYKSAMKPLKAKLETIRQNRENDLAQGMSLDDVIRKHSSVDAENAIRKEEKLHADNLAPLNEKLKTTYVFIPESMYDAYVRKVNEGKRGDYLTCVNTFLENLGIESFTQSALCKLSERIADRLGARVSTSKKLIEEGQFSSEMKKGQFSKLFMSVFCDILVQADTLLL